jgi:murein DD-endopeptidase MepM/ murein hydrolase activator NlpD
MRGPLAAQAPAPVLLSAKPVKRLGLVALLLIVATLVTPASARIGSSNGGLTYYDHVFPVLGPHWSRGYVGEFGAPRSGGRTHEGFDIVAACGTPLVAVRSGRVLRSGFDPVLYGNYLLIHGEAEHRSYFYAHMPSSALVGRGDRVYTGQRVGAVGKTGNAQTIGCHLHFEIHLRGRPVDPEPALQSWDR